MKPDAISEAVRAGLREWTRCQRSFPHFLTHVKLRDANKGVIPLEIWPHIARMAADWQTGESWMEGKARQVGVSWLLAAYDCWKLTFSQQVRILSISMGQEYSAELLDKVKFIHANLPPYLRLAVAKSNESTFEFQANGSRMIALPSTVNAGRGFQATVVQFDEFAFHPFAGENFDSTRNAMADGGQMLIVTTGNGPDNTFAQIWNDSNAPFKKRFTPWHARPDRDEEWYEREKAAYMARGRLMFLERENPRSAEEMFHAVVGLVYKDFSETQHVKVPDWSWTDAQYRVAGIDPGQGDPFAILPIGQHAGGHTHVFDEFYERGIVTIYQAREYLQSWHQQAPFSAIYCDHNEPTFIATLRAPDEYGRTLPVVPAPMYREVGAGISVVHSAVAGNTLSIAPHCENLLHEFKTFRWKTARSAGQEPWATSTPVDNHGDALAALRYGMTGLSKGFAISIEEGQPSVRRFGGKPAVNMAYFDHLAREKKDRQDGRVRPVRVRGPDYRPGRRTVRMGR